MKKEASGIVIAIPCPLCGHHLAGFGTLKNDILRIKAYCPLCDNEYTFEENKTIQTTESGVTDG